MTVSGLGISVIRYVSAGKATSHLLRPGNRTICGVKAQGSRWKMGQKFDPTQDCQRCARMARHGVVGLMRVCPKCSSDFGNQQPLLPNQKCANCGNQWT